MIRSPWVLGHQWDETAYEPCEWSDSAGGIVCSNPTRRGDRGHVTYEPNQFNAHVEGGYVSGNAHVGIGCAWREMGTDTVSVSVTWSGLNSIAAGHHVEGAPLVNVVPGTVEHGYGAWPSSFVTGVPGPDYDSEAPAIYLGTLGNPPEMFDPITAVVFPGGHVDGTPRVLTLETDGIEVQLYVDNIAAGTPVTLPVALQGGTKHGYAIDTHYVNSGGVNGADDWDGVIPTIPVITNFDARVL